MEHHVPLLAMLIAAAIHTGQSAPPVPRGTTRCYFCTDLGEGNECPDGPVGPNTPGVYVTENNVGCGTATGILSDGGKPVLMRFGADSEDSVIVYNHVREHGGCLDKEGLGPILEDDTKRYYQEITVCVCDTDLCNSGS